MECDLGRQAGDLVTILGEDVGQDRVCALYHTLAPQFTRYSVDETYRWDFLGKIDILGQLHLSLIKRALHIHILERIAEVGILVDERDESVFDLEVDFCALFHYFLEVALGFDGQGTATVYEHVLASVPQLMYTWSHDGAVLRFRRIRV